MVVIIRDRIIKRFYGEEGNLLDEALIFPGCETFMVKLKKGCWYNWESLETNMILFKGKGGKYGPLVKAEKNHKN